MPVEGDARVGTAEDHQRVGEPWALELFTPHWSLLTGTRDADFWQLASDSIVRRIGLFADERTGTLPADAVQLVREGDDGYFTVIASFPLTGS